MPEFRDTVHTKAFRAMFERLPPYTLHTMSQSREQEHARLKASFDAGFAERTQMGTSPQMRFHQQPSLSGTPRPPEAETGRVISTDV